MKQFVYDDMCAQRWNSRRKSHSSRRLTSTSYYVFSSKQRFPGKSFSGIVLSNFHLWLRYNVSSFAKFQVSTKKQFQPLQVSGADL